MPGCRSLTPDPPSFTAGVQTTFTVCCNDCQHSPEVSLDSLDGNQDLIFGASHNASAVPPAYCFQVSYTPPLGAHEVQILVTCGDCEDLDFYLVNAA